MKEVWNQFCTYFGSFLGFVGGLLLAIALGPIKEGYQSNAECVRRAKDMGVDLAIAMKQCAEYFVVMKHPTLNTAGLILVCVGFLIQFFPAIPKIFRWLYHMGASKKQRKSAAQPRGT